MRKPRNPGQPMTRILIQYEEKLPNGKVVKTTKEMPDTYCVFVPLVRGQRINYYDRYLDEKYDWKVVEDKDGYFRKNYN